MLAGTLEIQMMASMARLADDMHKAQGMVGGAMKNIERSVAQAKSVLASLGIGLSVIGFTRMVQGSIDAIDALNDLNKSTGITVQNLSGLRLAALQSGTDLNGVAAAVNKLSVNMGKDAEKFRGIGITARDPIEAFKQLADVFVSIEDPQQRAAVMAEALGKSWASAAPLLAEGGQRIGEMVEHGTQLAGVNKEMTAQAGALNDKWDELAGTGGLLNRQIGPMLPILNALADDMLALQKSSLKVSDGFHPLAEALRALIILGGNVAFVFKTIGNEIGGMAAQINMLAHGDLKSFSALRDMMVKEAQESRKAFDEWEQKMLSVGLTTQKVTEQAGAASVKMSKEQIKALDNFVKAEEKHTKRKADFDPEGDFLFAVEEAGRKNRKQAREDELKETERLAIQTAHEIAQAQKKAAEESERYWDEFQKNVQRNIGDVLYLGLQGKFRDIGDLFKQMLLRMTADAAAARLTQALFGTAGAGAALFGNAAVAATATTAATPATAGLLGVGGAAAMTPAMIAGAAVVGGLLLAKYGFGRGNERELVGGNRLVGQFGRGGFAGGWEQSWKQEGGWFKGDEQGVYKTALTTAQGRAFKATVDGLQKTFDALGDTIGYTATRTQHWKVDVNSAGDVVGLLADGMGAQLIPSLERLRLTGENLAQTAERMNTAFQSTNYFSNALGLSSIEAFGALGIAGADARLALVNAAGGLDAFNRNATFFVQNFLSEAQKIAPSLSTVGRTFAQLNIVGIETNAQFAERVALETKLGHYDVVAKLLSVSEAFNAVTNAASEMLSTKYFKTMVDYMRAVGRSGNAGNQIAAATAQARAILPQEDAANAAQARKDAKANALAKWQEAQALSNEYMNAYNASSGRPDHAVIGGIWTDQLAIANQLKAEYEALPSYASGTPFVQSDMTANIHRGEMVVDAQSANVLRRYGMNSANDVLVAEIRSLRSEVASLRGAAEDTARSTRKTSELLRNVTQDGNSVLTTAA